MDNYKDWLYALLKTEPIPPEDIPDIGLYMDHNINGYQISWF